MTERAIQDFSITWELPSGQQIATPYTYDARTCHGYTLDEYRLKVIQSCQQHGYKCVQCDAPRPKFTRI